MDAENKPNLESELFAGKPIYGPKGLKQVGEWADINGTLRESLDPFPLTDAQRKILDSLSGLPGKHQMLEWAEEYKIQNE